MKKNNWNKKKLYYYNNKYTPFCLHKKRKCFSTSVVA